MDVDTRRPGGAARRSLASVVQSGVRWQMFAQGTEAVLAVVTMLGLARLTTPHEFGIVALFLAFSTAIVSILCDPVANAVVVKRFDSSRTLSTAWWFAVIPTMLIAGFIAALVLVLSPSHDVVVSALAVATSLPLYAAAVVLVSVLQSRLRFRGLAVARLIAAVGGNALALAIAVGGHPLTGLLTRVVSIPLLLAVTACVTARWLPAARFDRRCAKSIGRYVRGIAGFNAVNQVARRGDDIIVGAVLGPTALGYYSLAYRFLELPVSQVGQVCQNVALPALTRLEDPQRFRVAFLRVQKVAVWAVAPLGICSIVFGDVAVRVLLGEHWATAGDIVRIFGVVAIIQAAETQVGTIYLAWEATDLLFRWAVISTPLLVLAMVAGLPWGPVGVACAYLVFNVIWLYPEWAIPGPLIGLTPAMVASSLARVVGLAFALAAAGCALRLVIDVAGAPQLVAGCALLSSTYWLGALALDRSVRRDAVGILPIRVPLHR